MNLCKNLNYINNFASISKSLMKKYLFILILRECHTERSRSVIYALIAGYYNSLRLSLS